jgi:hypothetical protein
MQLTPEALQARIAFVREKILTEQKARRCLFVYVCRRVCVSVGTTATQRVCVCVCPYMYVIAVVCLIKGCVYGWVRRSRPGRRSWRPPMWAMVPCTIACAKKCTSSCKSQRTSWPFSRHVTYAARDRVTERDREREQDSGVRLSRSHVCVCVLTYAARDRESASERRRVVCQMMMMHACIRVRLGHCSLRQRVKWRRGRLLYKRVRLSLSHNPHIYLSTFVS